MTIASHRSQDVTLPSSERDVQHGSNLPAWEKPTVTNLTLEQTETGSRIDTENTNGLFNS